jgi:gentisate 1,2-dioxygenase
MTLTADENEPAVALHRPTPDPAAVERLHAAIARSELQPLWAMKAVLLTETPRTKTIPWVWRWKDIYPLAQAAGELVPVDRGGDRRVLALSNPGLLGRPYATQTLWGGVQFLGAGESAPAHRHTPGAIRFVLQGEGVSTLVNGDLCAMSPGDLILTPGWNWHEHRSEGDVPMLWFDGLDLPTVEFLDAVFFEDSDDAYEQLELTDPPRDDNQDLFGQAGLRPDDEAVPTAHSPLLTYRWSRTDATLATLVDRRPDAPSVSLTFVDPLTGRDALSTMRCRMMRLRAGRRTPTTRTVGSSVLVCFRGRGTTVIDGQSLTWAAGDMVAVPSWAAVDHEADEDSDVFVLSDAPIVEALHLLRTQVAPEFQEIRSRFVHPRSDGPVTRVKGNG